MIDSRDICQWRLKELERGGMPEEDILGLSFDLPGYVGVLAVKCSHIVLLVNSLVKVCFM